MPAPRQFTDFVLFSKCKHNMSLKPRARDEDCCGKPNCLPCWGVSVNSLPAALKSMEELVHTSQMGNWDFKMQPCLLRDPSSKPILSMWLSTATLKSFWSQLAVSLSFSVPAFSSSVKKHSLLPARSVYSPSSRNEGVLSISSSSSYTGLFLC